MPDLSQFPIGASLTPDDLSGERHPLLHQLRATEPVSWLPALNCWLITSWELAVEVMRDSARFTVDHPGFTTAQVVGESMLSLDGERHRQHRQPFERPFRRQPVASRFTAPVTAESHRLIDDFIKNGSTDLRAAFCAPLAARMMQLALGLDAVPIAEMLDWYAAIVAGVTQLSAGEPLSEAAQDGYASLSAALQPVLRQPAPSSLLAAVAQASHGLSDAAIISNAAILLFGGIETTEGMLGNAIWHLLERPLLLNALQDDPSLWSNVLEESLRLEPAAAVVDRYATEDVVLGGVAIGAGALVRVSLAGANRDPAVFPDPDRFDLRRDNLHSHVTFAQGPHVCLGLHLARLEGEVALRTLFERLPDLRWAGAGETAVAARHPQGLIFRKPAALHVRWEVDEISNYQ